MGAQLCCASVNSARRAFGYKRARASGAAVYVTQSHIYCDQGIYSSIAASQASGGSQGLLVSVPCFYFSVIDVIRSRSKITNSRKRLYSQIWERPMRNSVIAAAIATVTLMSANGYAQADDVFLITGPISANGTPQVPSNTYTVSHPGTGHYVITFAPWVFHTSIPSCMIVPLGGVAVNSLHENVSYCDIQLSADTIFNFMAAPITSNIPLQK